MSELIDVLVNSEGASLESTQTKKLIGLGDGFKVKKGRTAGVIVNRYVIYEDDLGRYIEMYDHDGKSFTFDEVDLPLVKSVKTPTGERASCYIARTGTTADGSRDLEYVFVKINGSPVGLHALIMNNIKPGRGQISVDHIDRNPMNNRRYNLRLATQIIQNQNTGKRARKKNARPLPAGITQNDLPKYVIYYVKKCPTTTLGYCELFKIEKHPMQIAGHYPNKLNASSQAMTDENITIKTKLEQAKAKLKEMDDAYQHLLEEKFKNASAKTSEKELEETLSELKIE